jgi:NitT/TauT family transport system permease protein
MSVLTDQVAEEPATDAGMPATLRRRRRRRDRLRAIVLGIGFPILLVLLWDRAVALSGTRLIPSPRQVAVMMYDFTFGGIYDDAFSGTILTHVWKSMQRVYGGFLLAAAIAIPLGLMVGRIRVLRQLLDPTISLLRPIPVTAWLPLSMIFFGLGPNAAIFLVFLGAFYPILLNTIFGVRSVDVRLFEAAAMLGCSGPAMFRQVMLPAALPSIITACASPTDLPGS